MPEKCRRQFSRSNAAVNGLMQHLALSHPGISFKFIKDGVESLHTPGDGRLDSAVYMPPPLSLTRIRPIPPRRSSTTTAEAPASIAFPVVAAFLL